MKRGDRTGTEQWKMYDWQFHQGADFRLRLDDMMEAHAAAFDKYLRYQMIALSYRGDIAEREHQKLLECALKRDTKTACEVLIKHVAGGIEHAFATTSIH